jgi:hypothetical protein
VVNALLLGVRALSVILSALANFFQLTGHLLHGAGEGGQLASDARDVLFGCHAGQFYARRLGMSDAALKLVTSESLPNG